MGFIKVVLFQILFLATAHHLLAEDSAAASPAVPAGLAPDVQAVAEHPEGSIDPQHHQDRFFFGLFPRITACNYTRQAGATCSTCTQALTCLSSNIGLVRNCRGLFRYCNNGYCSLSQSAACANSTG